MWYLVSGLAGMEALRQWRRGINRTLETPARGRDLSVRLVMLPWQHAR
jgi:hypothetical protein